MRELTWRTLCPGNRLEALILRERVLLLGGRKVNRIVRHQQALVFGRRMYAHFSLRLTGGLIRISMGRPF